MGGFDQFKASPGWIQRWKRRNRVAIRRGTNVSQKLPEDYADQVHGHRQDILRKRVSKQYTPFNMINMDQTMCRFDMPSASTNDNINANTVRIAATGGSKKGFTVALTASASGAKSQAVIVLKEPTGRETIDLLYILTKCVVCNYSFVISTDLLI